jgi:hypothetical protein
MGDRMNDRVLVNDGVPLRTKVWGGPNAYAALDEGIRFAVRVLHAHGIETCQSCQGGDGHAYPVPTVDLLAATDATGFAALAYLHGFGLPVVSVSKHWAVSNGEPYEMIWRIEFARPCPERADEPLMFLCGDARPAARTPIDPHAHVDPRRPTRRGGPPPVELRSCRRRPSCA